MKTCSKCKIEKEFSEFSKRKDSSDGYRNQCKICVNSNPNISLKKKKYYSKNKEAIKKRVKDWSNINQDKIKENKKEYYQENKEKILERQKEWRLLNNEYVKDFRKIYYENNKDVIKAKSVEYYNEVKLINPRFNKDRYNRVKSDPEKFQNLKNRRKINRKKKPWIYAIRNILRGVLRRLNKNKTTDTITLLGYSSNELKTHLENLFKEGMSWENYGEWHIDHIKPISSFHPDTDLKIINSLDNLQPLWASENLSKGSKYNKEKD